MRLLGLSAALKAQTAHSWGLAMRQHCSSLSNRELQVSLVQGSEGIFDLSLKRPKAKNALGRQLLDELLQATHDLMHSTEARCVLLSSKVEGVFCAGADLKERAKMSQTETAVFVSKLRAAFLALENLPMPTIAVVDGLALGGGMELALSCDLRVAGSQAAFAMPETCLGIIPGAGGTQRLPRLIGLPKAKELIFTGRRVQFEEAHSMRLVEHAVHPGQSAHDHALSLAQDIAKGAPIAQRMAKTAMQQGSGVSLQAGMQIEQLCYAQVIPTEDRLEGLRAFAEKRAPKFTGR
ncbi:hypothetical protein WJX73_010926 [Symbiochloris irregularis]|uniref:Enoyl-CoA hydratase n=1 Tax=Symbiochloris irregularis TaxID=706552 RepID=A0AAW1NX47_9CHLO